MQFDHIGMIATSLENGRQACKAFFNISLWTEEFLDPVNRVYAQFGADASGVCYELIAPYGEDSPIAKSASAGKHVLAHVAYLVDDLEKSAEHMRDSGAVAIAEPKPALAYGGKKIQFFMTPQRFMIELIEAPGHQHLYTRTY